MTNRIPFLSAVLPQQGIYCIVGLKRGVPKQSFVNTLEEVDGLADGLIAQGYDVYFGCAKYAEEGGGRTAKNAKWFRSFWLDLDCGETKPYKTQAEALDALRIVVKAATLPRPTIVNSGRGVHIYWTLTQDIEYNDWKPTAEALKKFCSTYNIYADPAVTADAARILRIPETLNFKDTPPKQVDVLVASSPVDFASFRRLIGCYDASSETADLPFEEFPRQTIDATTRALMGNTVSRFAAIMRKSASGEGCAQLLHIYKDQAELEEPLWRAGLSIAVNCEDGDTAIHKISHQHAEYDPKETFEKAAALRDKPYKCATFAGLNPSLCQDCAFKGKITSPIQLGSYVARAMPEDNIVVMRNATLQEDITIEIPDYPAPYFRGKNGGIYKRGIGKDADGNNNPDELIYEYDFYVVKRLTDPDAGESLWMRLHMPKDGVREFSAPLSYVLSKDKFRDVLAYQGVTAYNKRLDQLMAYVTKWVQELQQLTEAEKARQQFGWHDEDTKFVIGNREITATSVNYSPSSAATAEVAAFYTKKGNIKEWSKVANIYARPGNEVRAFTLFAGFGSALFKFTKLNGTIIHLTNNGSGVGKTTVQMLVNSIWGRPVEPLMNQEDKYLARMHRLSVLGNLPPTIDELTNMPDEEVSGSSYAITHGRTRNRMQSQVNAERSNPLRWSLIAITSGNKSLYDQLFNLKDFPEGELMRIMEFSVAKADNLSKAESDEMFNPMYENYGIAGEIFIRYVIANLPEVLRMLSVVQRKLDRAAKFTQRERFWSATAACAITSGIITRKLGLHEIDVGAVYRWAVDTLGGMRLELRGDNMTGLARVGLFLNQHHNNMIVVNSFVDRRSGLMDAPIREPRGELMVRFEPDTKLLYISVKAFRDWCSESQISYKSICDELKGNGHLKGISKKSMSKGSDLSTPSVSVMVLDASSSEEINLDALLPHEPTS